MSKVQVLPLFSTPVYVVHDDEVSNDDIHSWIEYANTLPTFNSLGGSITSQQNILLSPELSELKTLVDWHVSEYLYNVLSLKPDYTFSYSSSWFNIRNRNEEVREHCHRNSHFSGVFYLKIPPESGNALTFTHSLFFPAATFGLFEPEFKQANIYNSRAMTVELDDKMLLLFPSHTMHRVPPSQSNDTRYSLAFNLTISGPYGDCTTDTAYI